MGFNDLNFKTHSARMGGVQATVFYPNGYGASIVQTPFSYGGSEGKYEMAVLKGEKGNSSLCYDTPITDDVLGYLDEAEVERYLKEIEALPTLEAK